MLKRVQTTDIELGMFIHKLEGSWFKHPFWKARFLLTDPRMLSVLSDSEVDAVIIDTERGLDLRPQHRADAPATTPKPAQTPTRFGRSSNHTPPSPMRNLPQSPPRSLTAPTTTVREFGTARKLADRVNKVVSRVFIETRLGKGIAMNDVSPVIEDVYASVQRNLYAFNGLLRCRQDSEYVYRHSLAVSALMIALARQMKLSPLDMREAGMAGLLMDIGVGQLPVDLSPVQGDYRDLRPELLHQHVLLGHALLKAAGDMPDQVLRVCLRHHERLDGTGYPQGLIGDDVDLLSRMAAICDVYDNLVTGSALAPALDPAVALARLGDLGGAIDGEILQHFVAAVGVYPIGAFVRLRSDRLAMVVDEDPADSTLPTVRTFHSLAQGKRIKGETIALARCYGQDEIVGIADLDGLDLPDPASLRQTILAAVCREAGV